MRLARTYFQGLNRKDYETEYMSLYYLLARMERTSDYVRQMALPASIPLLDMMAENGPFSDAKENDRYKADQRNLVKGHRNRRLVYVEGTSHNIPHDKPALMIERIYISTSNTCNLPGRKGLSDSESVLRQLHASFL